MSVILDRPPDDAARTVASPEESTRPDPLFERELGVERLPAARRTIIYAVRAIAGAASLGGAWTTMRLVHVAPAWAGFACAAAVAAAWCGWLELRGPRG